MMRALALLLGPVCVAGVVTRRAVLGAAPGASLGGASLGGAWTPTAVPLRSVAEAALLDELPFARYPDPVLRLESPRAVVAFDDALRRCVALLRAGARAHGAVGLAANQCGVDAAIVVVGDEVLVNPRVVARSPEAEMVPWREGCLALPPDVAVETLRDREVVVACDDCFGRPRRRVFRGGDARQFLHEHDHGRGILIIDHAAALPRSALFPSLARREARDHDARVARAWARGVAAG